MKRIGLWVAIVAMGFILSGCSCCRRAGGGTVELFNGKDLTGWRATLADPAVQAEQVWSVREGVLICRGEPLGYLASERSYTNLRLEAEYRWAPGQKPGNSGLFVRVNGPARALPRCLETQLKHGNAGDVLGLQGMPVSGEVARFSLIPKHEVAGDIAAVRRLEGNEKPAGEWNRVEVLVRGGDVTVWFNGRKVNEAHGAEVVAGPVGLQSEGGEIHFRNVRLTPLE